MAETDQPLAKVNPVSKPYNLLEACRKLIVGEETLTVDFAEGLKVQRWIDELLK